MAEAAAGSTVEVAVPVEGTLAAASAGAAFAVDTTEDIAAATAMAGAVGDLDSVSILGMATTDTHIIRTLIMDIPTTPITGLLILMRRAATTFRLR
jgi:hypothetical protein